MKGKTTSSYKKILFCFAFVFALYFSSAFVQAACTNPTVYNEKGTPINPLGSTWLVINGTKYSAMQIDFPISVKNKNDDQGISVTLRPYRNLRSYIDDAHVYLQPGEKKQFNLRVWVGGQSYEGIIQVFFMCDDGTPQMFFPVVNTFIVGQGHDPPPTSTCESRDLDGCYNGMRRDYYCSNGQLTYTAKCTEYCCQSFGGRESMCSSDKQKCMSFNTLPPGTEGNIAFICKDSSCASSNERSLAFLFRLNGWNVTMLPANLWTEAELKKNDIITCADYKKSCAVTFNSLIYNQHINERMPFLELSSERAASAAFAFDYITSKRASKGRYIPFIETQDYITSGFDGSVQTTSGASKYLTVKDADLAQGAIDLADSGSQQSVMFKMKEDVDHGRYAFVGWLNSISLTRSGNVLFNRTLKWLKGGDAVFGGQNYNPEKKGNIAFICNKNSCTQSNEVSLIKYLRKNGYYVVGKTKDNWSLTELNNYDLIVCSDSSACSISSTSAVYLAHKIYGKPFLEIPYKGGASAAQAFGYVNAKTMKKVGFGIVPQGSDAIFSGFNGYMETASGKSFVFGPTAFGLSQTANLAANVDGGMSVMFSYDAAGSRGRYAYVGWLSATNSITENGKKLLLRTIEWLRCGNSCLPDFNSVFGDLSLKFDINSPLSQAYTTNKIYLNISINQRVKEITASINDGRPKKICKNCDSVFTRMRLNYGPNKIAVNLIDYTGKSYERAVYLTANR